MSEAAALAHAPSWYAASIPEQAVSAPLQGDLEADVVVLGAGLTGLSAALELAESGRRVVVLESTKTTGRALVPVGRIAAKLLARKPFTVRPNEASTLFARLTRQLLIDDLTFHDSRGSALTWLSKRVDVMTLARISRHKDLSLLMKVYYRESADEIAAKLR